MVSGLLTSSRFSAHGPVRPNNNCSTGQQSKRTTLHKRHHDAFIHFTSAFVVPQVYLPS